METEPGHSDIRTMSDRPKSIFKRLYEALKEFDKALDYDPLDDLSAKVRRLEKDMSEIKQSLSNPH